MQAKDAQLKASRVFADSIDMAIRTMVIDHADGLHEGIENNGADKFEPALF